MRTLPRGARAHVEGSLLARHRASRAARQPLPHCEPALQLLHERRAARAAVIEPLIGDDDAVDRTNAKAGSREAKALDTFATTVPTTLPGLLEALIYAAEVAERDYEAFREDPGMILSTLATASRNLTGRQA